MLDWNEYRSEVMQRVGDLGKLTPETLKASWLWATPAIRPTSWARKCVN